MELEITCLPTWIQGIKSPGRDYTALCSWLAGGRAGGERGLLQVAMPSVLHFDIMCGYKKEGGSGGGGAVWRARGLTAAWVPALCFRSISAQPSCGL